MNFFLFICHSCIWKRRLFPNKEICIYYQQPIKNISECKDFRLKDLNW